jgi:hypothetical protein
VCTSTPSAEFALDRSIETPGHARGITEVHVCRVHGMEALPAAKLLVTELITCAVLYGQAPVRLSLDCQEGQLLIVVTHGVPAGATAEELPIDEAGGLRSALLDKLSRSWGAERSGETDRRLWCLIPTGHAPTRGRITRPGVTRERKRPP